MKTIREYHVQHYWEEAIAKKQKKAELKEKIPERLFIIAFFLGEVAFMYEFIRQMFEAI